MSKGGFLRTPSPAWALQLEDAPAEAVLLAERAVKLFETRRLIWRVNLTLIGILVLSHVSLKFLIPGFPAAEYLATEITLLEGATVVLTRRMVKEEEQLKEQFSKVCRADT